MNARDYRKKVKAALLRSRVPFKGSLARAYLRANESYLNIRARGEGEVQANGYPVPPARLRTLVSGTPDLERFLHTGSLHARYLRELLERVDRPLGSMDAILDFGCGCGRIMRWFTDANGTELHGCDYNDDLIRWCTEHLTLVHARTSELRPPLPYADGSFDFLYAFSVFTHLSVELARQWLAEIERVLKPGGLMWFTVHGESYRERLLPEEKARFDEGEIVVWLPEIEGTNMCGAYWPEASVERMLGERYEVLTHFNPQAEAAAAGRIELAHDAYLVRRL
jgi:SAM-dependent methyltransferase